MLIKQGTKLTINHSRKGTMNVVVTKDFDSTAEWWPVALDQGEVVKGASIENSLMPWREGDEIPCRRILIVEWTFNNETEDMQPTV